MVESAEWDDLLVSHGLIPPKVKSCSSFPHKSTPPKLNSFPSTLIKKKHFRSSSSSNDATRNNVKTTNTNATNTASPAFPMIHNPSPSAPFAFPAHHQFMTGNNKNPTACMSSSSSTTSAITTPTPCATTSYGLDDLSSSSTSASLLSLNCHSSDPSRNLLLLPQTSISLPVSPSSSSSSRKNDHNFYHHYKNDLLQIFHHVNPFNLYKKDQAFKINEEEDEIGDDDEEEEEEIKPSFEEKFIMEQFKAQKMERSLKENSFHEIIDISQNDFNFQVTQESSKYPVILYLYKENHQDSDLLHELLLRLAKKYPSVKFCKMNFNQCLPNSSEKNIPALFIYKNGDLIKRFYGYRSFTLNSNDLEHELKDLKMI